MGSAAMLGSAPRLGTTAGAPSTNSGARSVAASTSSGIAFKASRGIGAIGAMVGQGVALGDGTATVITDVGSTAIGCAASAIAWRPITFQPAATPKTLTAPSVTLWAVVTFFALLMMIPFLCGQRNAHAVPPPFLSKSCRLQPFKQRIHAAGLMHRTAGCEQHTFHFRQALQESQPCGKAQNKGCLGPYLGHEDPPGNN